MFRRTVLNHLGARPLTGWSVFQLDLFVVPSPRWEAYGVGALWGRPALVLSQGLLATLSQGELAELARSARQRIQKAYFTRLTVLSALSLWMRRLMPASASAALFEGERLERPAHFGSTLWILMLWPTLALLSFFRTKPFREPKFELGIESLRLERSLGQHDCPEVRPLSLLAMFHGENHEHT